MNEIDRLLKEYDNIGLSPDADLRIKQGINRKMQRNRRIRQITATAACLILCFIIILLTDKKDPDPVIINPTNTPSTSQFNPTLSPQRTQSPMETIIPVPTRMKINSFTDFDNSFKYLKDKPYYNDFFAAHNKLNLYETEIVVIDIYESEYIKYLYNSFDIAFEYNEDYGNMNTEMYYNSKADMNAILEKSGDFDYVIYEEKNTAYFISGSIFVLLRGYDIENILISVKE